MGEFIPFSVPEISNEEINGVVDTLRPGWITTGPKVKQFESDFQDFAGSGVGAMASGCFIIASNVAPLPEGLGKNNGLLFKVTDEAGLANKIVQVAMNEDGMLRKSKSSKQYAYDNYLLSRCALNHFILYNRLVKKEIG